METIIIKRDCKVATIQKMSDVVIHANILNVQPIPNENDALEFIDIVIDLADHKPFFILVDTSALGYTNWSSEAKECLAKHEKFNSLCQCFVIVISSLPISLVFKLYVSFFKPKVKTKIYKTKDKALKYLKRKESNFLKVV